MRREGFQRISPVEERVFDHHFAAWRSQHVEKNKCARRLRAQFADPAFGGVKTRLQSFKRKCATDVYDDFAVDDELFRQWSQRRDEFRKVPAKWFARLGAQLDCIAVP